MAREKKSAYDKAWEELTQIAKFCKKYDFDCENCPISKCRAPSEDPGDLEDGR